MNFIQDKRFWYSIVAVIVVVIVVAAVFWPRNQTTESLAPATTSWRRQLRQQRHQSSNASYSPFHPTPRPSRVGFFFLVAGVGPLRRFGFIPGWRIVEFYKLNPSVPSRRAGACRRTRRSCLRPAA